MPRKKPAPPKKPIAPAKAAAAKKPPQAAATPEPKATLCAIYARVSTLDKGQDTENQLFQLREYAARSGWKIAKEYVDHASGKSGDRDALKEMCEDVTRRKFDIVLVWALDRLTREGVYAAFDYVRKFTQHGVQFESYSEAHFRTTGPAGELMLAVAAWIAKQERLRISERTKAGMDRARREGKCIGRPARVFRRDLALELRGQGLSLRAIARKLGVSFMTVSRALKGEAQGPVTEQGSIIDAKKARRLHASGVGTREIAKQLGVSRGTVRRVLSQPVT